MMTIPNMAATKAEKDVKETYLSNPSSLYQAPDGFSTVTENLK